jgi:ATP-dependent DNA helicase DinG
MPSRLLTAFPPGVRVERVTLDEAVWRASRLPSVTRLVQETRQDA